MGFNILRLCGQKHKQGILTKISSRNKEYVCRLLKLFRHLFTIKQHHNIHFIVNPAASSLSILTPQVCGDKATLNDQQEIP